ncbi:hypothetical protein MFLAVUS_000149 [Mucor flavus]|uniref:Fork-head domain-containing protein n=1 Tax=Mucor flavus TaxID=439312 RepID=A0ABP9YIX3_9FUNG
MNTSTRLEVKDRNMNYLPPIPVALRHPMIVASVKQYRTESQSEQLHTHIVSESFIPMAPDLIKPPRKRRRPPFSYSSLIAQAILESENERMTLRDIYTWITSRYPALYNEKDTGWQNTIRHNLSLNRCFKKISKAEMDGIKGKGGYWAIDPTHMEKFKNGAFVRGSSSLLRRKPANNNSNHNSFSPNSPDTPDTTTNSTTYPVMQIHNLLN